MDWNMLLFLFVIFESVITQETPGLSQGAPEKSQNIPMVPQGAPGKSQDMPMGPQVAPGKSQDMPIIPQGVPVKPQVIPMVPQRAPGKSQGMPMIPQIAPGKSQDMPMFPQGVPVKSQDIPMFPQEALGMAQEMPMFPQEAPKVSQDMFTFSQGDPWISQEMPLFAQGVPEMPLEAPGMVQGIPMFAQEAPGSPSLPDMSLEIPGISQQTPRISQEAPGIPQDASGMSQEAPGMPQDPPGLSQGVPGMTEGAPRTEQRTPGMRQQTPVVYDAYFGKPISEKRRNFLANVVNGTRLCTIEVQPCRKDEGRRVDGTCTNPKYPSRGAGKSPLPRLLPPQFGQGNTLRPAKDGSELPSTRYLRTQLIGAGSFSDHHFSTLATHVIVATAADNVDLLYLFRYALGSDCCAGNTPNRVNPLCIPIPVPAEDPYLRESGIRCLNLSRVVNYQDHGCLPNTLPSERYSIVTPLLDLSTVYGFTEERSRTIRANQGGLLSFRMEGDREVPDGNSVFCIYNRPPEVSCYNFGDDYQSNLLSGIYLTAMWFFREHNRIARRLAKINPCWGDDKLFQTARQINIAQYQYIIMYELVPEFMGRKNAMSEGIIYETDGYVNDFDPHYEPGVIREYIIGLRWFHTFQPGPTDLYRNGKYIGTRPTPDDELRSGILSINNTEADLTEGSLIQPADKFDYIMAPDLAERYLGPRLRVADLPATDMMRGRDGGLPPYNHYRKFCGLKPAKHWEDFYDTIDKDKVDKLRRIYDDIEDVEVMVAIYNERFMLGAYVGPTLYCIMTHNYVLWRRSDKFFFEHGDYPAALTIPQLNEVRKTSIARVLCDSGDDVKYIQPAAFFRRGPWNSPVPCEEIPGMNLNKWKDHWCPKDHRK